MIAPSLPDRAQRLSLINRLVNDAQREQEASSSQGFHCFTKELHTSIIDFLLIDLYIVDSTRLPEPTEEPASFNKLLKLNGSEETRSAVHKALTGHHECFLEILKHVSQCKIFFKNLGPHSSEPSHVVIYVYDSPNRANIKLEAARKNLNLIFDPNSKVHNRHWVLNFALNRPDLLSSNRPSASGDDPQLLREEFKSRIISFLNGE